MTDQDFGESSSQAPPPAAPPPRKGPRRWRRGDMRRGAYLVPSLFTTANLILGFYSMVLGLQGDFQLAVLLIFVAAFIDGLDGRLARVTETDSDFGREFDSLADVVTFGVAPAMLIYIWGLESLGRIGWLFPAFYLSCTATRLARFNVNTRVADNRFFVGIPSPAAAGGIGSLLYFSDEFFSDSGDAHSAALILLAGALLFFGLMMVSTFRYYSFKELDPRRRWTFRIAMPLAAIILLIAFHPAAFFLIVSGSYALSGPSLWLRGQLRRKDPARPSSPVDSTLETSRDEP